MEAIVISRMKQDTTQYRNTYILKVITLLHKVTITMNAETKILVFLLNNRESKPTIRSISQSTSINYRIVHEKIGQLEQEGIITTTKTGSARTCSLTNKFTNKIFEAEYMRREEILKNKDLRVLHERLSELPFSFIALLFGSHAKGKANKHSDIDILTIGGNEKEIKALFSLWPGPIHLTSITYQEFIAMARNRQFTVVTEAMKNNIILLEIEEYYRLVSHVA
ncbi:MAG: nucleotidyltransferase domain-containing protein [Candidatus Woesearchaeota archaeon]